MPDFELTADGVPFTVTANSRDEALKSLAEEIDANPAILEQARAAMAKAGPQQAPQAPQGPQEQPVQVTAGASPTPQTVNPTGAQDRMQQAMQTPGMPALLGGAGTAMTEVGQAVSDWISKGLDWVGLEGPAQKMGQVANSLEEREMAVRAGAAQLANDWYTSLYGEPPADPEALKKSTLEGTKVAEMASMFALGGGTGKAALGAKTLLGQMALITTEGALTGALLGDSDKETVDERLADRTGDMKFGAVLGLGMSGIVGPFTSIRNYFAKMISDARQQGDRAFALADQFDVPITLGQATGNPKIANIETQAASNQAQKFFAQQAEESAQKIAQKIPGIKVRPLDQVGLGTGQQLDEVVNQVESAVIKMKQIRNVKWRDSIQEAVDIAGDTGIMKPTHFGKVAEDVAQDLSQFGRKFKMSEDFMDMMDEIKTGNVAGWTPQQINKWWLRLNDWKKSGVGLIDGFAEGVDPSAYKKQVQVLAGKLSGALDKELEMAARAAGGDGPVANALAKLGSARTNYKAASDEIRVIEDDFIKGLGLGGTPASVLKKLQGADPMQVRKIADHIRKMDGGEIYLGMLQDAVFDAAVKAGLNGAVSKGLKAGSIDIPAFAQALSDGTKRSVLMGISSPQVERNANQGLELLRTMLNASEQAMPGGVQVKQLPVSIQDIAINAISRSPEFIARTFAGALARGHNMESLFFTRDGINALRALHPDVVRAGAWKAKRNAVITWYGMQTGDDAKNEADAKYRARTGAQ